MGGYYTDSRKAMGKSSWFYDQYTISSGGIATPTTRTFVRKGDYFNLPNDSVYSYRSNRGDFESSLRNMINNADFNPLNQFDTGHEFKAIKRYTTRVSQVNQGYSTRVPYAGGYFDQFYRGPFVLGQITPVSGMPSSPLWGGKAAGLYVDPPELDLIVDGTNAIKVAAPTKSQAHLTVALLELRDGLPKIPGMTTFKNGVKKPSASDAGSEYLNVVFGWAPAVSDIVQILVAMTNAQKIVNQYTRDSDKTIRRQRYFPISVDTVTSRDPDVQMNVSLTAGHPGSNSYNHVGNWGDPGIFTKSGKLPMSLTQKTTIRKWFSGSYRYHLNDDPSIFGRMERTSQIAAKLLGDRLDVDTIFQALPWSWFIDWFVDLGSIITNGNATLLDGQVMQYAYMMCESTIARTFTIDEPLYVRRLDGTTDLIGPLSTTYVSQRKQRVRASPYGFGLNPNSFSAQQWAVLGALGMTKAPRSLR